MLRPLFRRRSDAQALCASKLFNNETFYEAFIRDLSHSMHRVYIESPFITTRRIKQLMPVLERLSRANIQITVNTRHPNEHEGEYIEQAVDAVRGLQKLGITVMYTGRLHRKIAIIDGVLWEGSLNILSYNDSCEVMRRIASSELVDEMLCFTMASQYVA